MIMVALFALGHICMTKYEVLITRNKNLQLQEGLLGWVVARRKHESEDETKQVLNSYFSFGRGMWRFQSAQWFKLTSWSYHFLKKFYLHSFLHSYFLVTVGTKPHFSAEYCCKTFSSCCFFSSEKDSLLINIMYSC